MLEQASSRLSIQKLSYEQAEGLYPLLYRQVSQGGDPTHQPAFVYIGQKEGNYVGFMACYRHNIETAYIQYAGFLPEYQGYPVVPFLKQALAYVHEEFRYILALIQNDNVRALRVAMACGFKIIGIRQATDKTLLVELLKEK